jgi:hypothetical protein
MANCRRRFSLEHSIANAAVAGRGLVAVLSRTCGTARNPNSHRNATVAISGAYFMLKETKKVKTDRTSRI